MTTLPIVWLLLIHAPGGVVVWDAGPFYDLDACQATLAQNVEERRNYGLRPVEFNCVKYGPRPG